MSVMSRKAYSEPSLPDLRVLNSLLREHSITRTAELMGTTQPAVSKVLGHLRRQFADPLFVRNGRAMQPTAKALEVADRLRVLLAAADELRASATAFDPAASDRLFSLLLTDVGMIHFLPSLIARLAEAAPKARVRAVPLQSHQFEARLEAGDADLALGAFPKAARHLRRQRLYHTGYLSVVRRGHPRLAKARSRSGFLAEQHILVTASEAGHAAHGAVQKALAAIVPRPNILLQVPSFVAGAVVGAGKDRLATLPAHLLHPLTEPLGLVAFDTPGSLPRIAIAQYLPQRYHRCAG